MRPDDLARELGISPKTLRDWLRREYRPDPRTRGPEWHLNAAQVAAARERWAPPGRHIAPAQPRTAPAAGAKTIAHDVEALRRAHRPDRITVLFVGESAPAGGTFFYAQNSTLYFETRAGFVAERLAREPDFLARFQALGCYLDDLCLEPVNHLPDAERVRKRRLAEKGLADRIAVAAPQAIVAIGKTTAASHVARAVTLAASDARLVEPLPFPSYPSHKQAFHDQLRALLRDSRNRGLV